MCMSTSYLKSVAYEALSGFLFTKVLSMFLHILICVLIAYEQTFILLVQPHLLSCEVAEDYIFIGLHPRVLTTLF
jgi:hypothetical protein